MEDFIHSQGVIWLPHIMRRLVTRFLDACDTVFPDFEIIVPPTMVSTVHLLFERGPQTVTGIAAATSQSHPLINRYVRQLGEMGLVETGEDPRDKRRTMVSLTAEGRVQAEKLVQVREAFVPAYHRLLEEADVDLFDALWRIEAALRSRPFAERILAERQPNP
jgi:DNA-binding MarR family transcriptional regulator